jgi:5'-3' exoribonuclease 1
MYEDTSSIIDFYPKTFALDMNGKKADWEAVVKIPFIDEERLLRAMDAREHRLTPEEKQRNSAGVPPTEFTYDDSGTETSYASSLAGFFPDLVACRCKAQPFDMPQLEDDELVLKLMDGVHLGASALAGFPSLATLPYQGTLGYHSVNVFQQDSRNQSMVITITGKHDKANTGDVAKRFIGQRTFHSWPYLHEGIVTGVSDDMFKYELQQFGNATKVISKPHDGFGAIKWKKDADKIEHHYSKRCGVIIGHVNVILHVSPLKGELTSSPMKLIIQVLSASTLVRS